MRSSSRPMVAVGCHRTVTPSAPPGRVAIALPRGGRVRIGAPEEPCPPSPRRLPMRTLGGLSLAGSALPAFTAMLAVAAVSLLAAPPARAATFVYVSNAEDGDIGTYTLRPDGALAAGPRVPAGKVVMPMAVSPDKRFLYAGVRSRPYSVHAYAIDPPTGALTPLGTAPLAESFPYISLDKTGRWLLGASYSGHLISVNAVGPDGRVAAPLQVIPVGRNAHAIRVDESNKFAFVP